ncbi:hypothetical protein GCM10009613_11560 [Pseudonocardia kongjuensis]|uniref:Uncharacterized protein n=1 Tax=Pseudonocardia kongjuensis TaxID=102227 RepID=A0ABN1XJ53_9PSEU
MIAPPKRLVDAVDRAAEMTAAIDHAVKISGVTDPLDVLDVRLAVLLIFLSDPAEESSR